jgi:uncharacterized membrane protein
LWQLGFGTRSLLLRFTARIKSLLALQPSALAMGSAVLLSEPVLRYRFFFLVFLWLSGNWNQKFSAAGFNYSLFTGICVGAGTIAFFLLFQRGGPLSAVPAILAGGAAIMAITGILFSREAASWQRIVGVAFAIIGLFLLRK